MGEGTKIREVLRDHARLQLDVTTLRDEDDLYAAGLTSRASVSVMLALEDVFEVEFPDELLGRDVFSSIGAIRVALNRIRRA